MAGLADTCQKFVNRLGRIDHGVHRTHALLTHCVISTIKRVERCVRQPCFVKMQVRDVAIQHLFDGLGVVEHAVIGGLGDRQHTWNRFFRIHTLQQRVRLDLGLNCFWLKLALRNRPDDAVMVARRL